MFISSAIVIIITAKARMIKIKVILFKVYQEFLYFLVNTIKSKQAVLDFPFSFSNIDSSSNIHCVAATVDVSGGITLSYRNCNDKLPVWCLESNQSSAIPVTSLITTETTSSLISSKSTSYSKLLTTESNSASIKTAIGIIHHNSIINGLILTYCLLINY